MAKVLISCIGTGRVNSQETSKRIYEKATYAIDNTEYKTSFVSEALFRNYNIEKVILIGTVKSMWEEVYRVFSELHSQDIDEEKLLELGVYCENANSTSPLYLPYQDEVEKAMGKDSHIILVNYGLNKSELTANSTYILGIEQYLNSGDELYIDITHSFRSIPLYMMNLLIYMKNVSKKKITIKHISYGMFEAKSENGEKTPIIDISDILAINDWLVGAYSFREFGNAYKINELLENGNDSEKSAASLLEMFSDTVNLNHMVGIRHFSQQLSSIKRDELTAIARQIVPQVVDSFRKEFTSPLLDSSNALFQLKVAKWHNNHKNYASAYMALLEAIITHTCECNKMNWEDFNDREQAKDILRKNKVNLSKEYKKINEVRNKLVHAKKTNKDVSDMIGHLKSAISTIEEQITYDLNRKKKKI